MVEKSESFFEEKVVDPTNVLLCFLLAVAVVLFIIGSITTFDMDTYNSIVLAVSTVFIYGLIVYALLRPKVIKRPVETKIEKVEIKTIERQPIINKIEHTVNKTFENSLIKSEEKPLESLSLDKPVELLKIDKPVEKPIEVVKTVEKPVIRTIEKPVLSHITIEHPKKTLDIPKYAYRGSSETKIYHKTTCRLSKSIKNKYKVSANSENYFIKRGYTPCKACIDKPRKGSKKVSKKLPVLKSKKKVTVKKIVKKIQGKR